MILLFAACTHVTSPSTETPTTVDLSERALVMQSLADELVAADYQRFIDRANTLANTTAAFCAAPDASGRQAVRAAWLDTREPFKHAELVQFGPIVDEPSRVGPKVDLWPVRRTVVDDFLEETTALIPDDVAQFGGALRGFPVMEYVLWHPERTDLPTSRDCTFLIGLANDLEGQANVLHDAWLAYEPQLIQPELFEDPYATTQDVLDEWVNRMFFTVENLRFDKLGKPLGDENGGNPLPLSAESPFSGRSLDDARDALAGVRAAYDGVEHPIRSLVSEDRAETLPVIDGHFDDAQAALAAIPSPLTDSLTSDREAIQAAQDALRVLQIDLQVSLAQALSVTIAFNDNDGD